MTRVSLDALAPRGQLVVYGALNIQDFHLGVPELLGLVFKNQSVTGFALAPLLTPERLQTGLAVTVRGHLQVTIGGTYPLERAAKAHRTLEGRRTVGKVVLARSSEDLCYRTAVPKERPTRREVQVLVACCAAFFSVLSYRSVIYSLMPAVSAETGLHATTVGLIMAATYIGHVGGILGSSLVPLRRRHAVMGGLLVAVAAVVGFSVFHSPWNLGIAGAVGGLGLGLYLTRGTAAIIETFAPGGRARAMGWHEVASSAGLMGGGLLVGVLLLFVSWRLAVALWALVALAAAVLVWRWLPDAPPSSVPVARPRLDTRVWAFALLGGAGLAVHGGFYTILPTLLVDAWGLTPASAATFSGWARGSGFVGALAGGWTSDRMGRVPSLAGWYVVSLVGAGILPTVAFGWAFTGALVTMTVGACAAVTSSYALLGDAYRPAEVESVFGPIAVLVSIFGSVLTPIGLGAALEHFGAHGASVTIAAAPLLGLGGVALYAIHQKHGAPHVRRP